MGCGSVSASELSLLSPHIAQVTGDPRQHRPPTDYFQPLLAATPHNHLLMGPRKLYDKRELCSLHF